MPAIVLTVDENALESQSDIPQLQNANPDEHPTPADVRTLLEAVDVERIGIEVPFEHSEWECGDPRPECGSRSLTVLKAEGDIYDSF